MTNNFPTEAEWKTFVTKYKIPEKIAKAHAKKIVGLRKSFDDGGLNRGSESAIVKIALPAADKFLDAATRASHDFTRALDLDSGMAKDDIKKAKERWVMMVLRPIQNVYDAAKKKAVDGFAQSRQNAPLAVQMFSAWASDKTDPVKLTNMYSQGMRNHLGANINKAPGNLTDEVEALVKEYQQLVAKWMDPVLKTVNELVKQPDQLVALEKDMRKLLELGKDILAKTKP